MVWPGFCQLNNIGNILHKLPLQGQSWPIRRGGGHRSFLKWPIVPLDLGIWERKKYFSIKYTFLLLWLGIGEFTSSVFAQWRGQGGGMASWLKSCSPPPLREPWLPLFLQKKNLYEKLTKIAVCPFRLSTRAQRKNNF